MLKNNAKGITLIALIITIIVLLVLAGVTIAMLTGENGIINKAMQAKIRTEEAKETEEAGLKEIENYLNGKSVEAGAVVGGNKGKSLAALGNESDADLPAVALLDAGSGLNACGVDFVGSAL